MAINSWLLDMKALGFDGAKDEDTMTSSWSLAFSILAILIKPGIMFTPINYNMHKQAEHWQKSTSEVK
jgi:hypothetical protein